MNQTLTATAARGVALTTGLLTTVLCASGCASGSGSAAAAGSTASEIAQTTGASPSVGASAASAPAAQGSPSAAMTRWLQQVVRGDYAAVCRDMGVVAGATPGPTPFSATTCASTLTHLHDNFATDGLTPQSPITIGTVGTSGDSATIDGTDVHVSGTTLTSLMVAHSTGVQPGQFSISFKLSRIGTTWYVTDMNMNI